MSVAVHGTGTDAELQITLNSVNEKLLLLPFGVVVGDRTYSLQFRVFATTPDGKDRAVVSPGDSGVTSGVPFPLVMPLVPNASYTVQKQIGKSYVLDGSVKLQTFALQPFQLRVELDISNPGCSLYGYRTPSTIPCWQGKLVSNVLRLPK